MKADALSQLLDVILDDLSARFIINLPEEELSSVTRICFGLEQAHWFYEDFFRPRHPALPSVNLRAFTAALFSHCPLLWKFSGQHEAAFDDFLKYKIRVPVRGAIMLNKEMDKCVLVKGWKASAGWGFPKGKIDKEEDDAACAVREVREECGFDISPFLEPDDFVDLVMKEQSARLYIVRGVPTDTKFEPQTRKEISKIDWFSLDDLPTYKKDVAKEQTGGKGNNKYYMVAPFLGPLRRWIKKNKPKTSKKRPEQVDHLENTIKTKIQPITTNAKKIIEEITESTKPGPDPTEASSQALKLLLGIVDVPAASQAHDHSVDQDSEENGAGSIDLASLFLKPSVRGRRSNTEGIGSSDHGATVPMNLLNTSIETSILDQLLPNTAQNFHEQTTPVSRPCYVDPHYMHDASGAPPFSHYNHQQHHHQALPPWMIEPNRPDIGTSLQQLPRYLSRPMPPPDLEHIQHLGQWQTPFPHADHGPPGLTSGLVMPSSSPPRKTNPNAQSLLAILKPQVGVQGNTTSNSTIISPPPLRPDQSTRNRMPVLPTRSGVNAAPQHTESLLALLKPAGMKKSDSGPSSSVTGSQVPQNDERPSARDAFLLDYLTQAAGGRQ